MKRTAERITRKSQTVSNARPGEHKQIKGTMSNEENRGENCC